MFKDIFVMVVLNESGKEIWRGEWYTPDYLMAIAMNHRVQFPRENAHLTFKMHSYRTTNPNHKCS